MSEENVPESAPPPSEGGSRRVLRFVIPAVLLAALAIGAVVLLTGSDHNTRTYTVPSEAMEPTIPANSKVDVDLDAYKSANPEINDIVVFYPPRGAEGLRQPCGDPGTGASGSSGAACDQPIPARADLKFIKRVVAGPGDTLSIENGHSVVNGRVAQEDFIRPCTPGGSCYLPETITIPPDHYFMLGDNRGSSEDSRFWGPIPREWIIGKVTGH
jgi:signal peptidase I